MLCDICKKNEATIHIQEIVGGQKKSVHLCSECAAARNEAGGMDFGPFNLAGLLYKLTGEKSDPEDSAQPGAVCNVCLWSEKQLKETGRLGCGNCYKVFAPMLADVLKNMHNGSVHIGKQPSGNGNELAGLHSKLAKLQKELRETVEVEDYERAAELRDEINELKKLCNEAKKCKKGGNDE